MKAIEKHLYIRRGYFYYRSALPQNLHKVLPMRETVIALNSQDLREARVLAVQLNYEEAKALKSFQQELKESSPDSFPEQAVTGFMDKLHNIKQSVGYENFIPYDNPAWNLKRGKQNHGLLFSELYQKYIKDCVSDTRSTHHKKQTSYDLFIEILGDLPLKNIGKEEARAYKNALLKIPSNAKRILKIESFKGIDLDKIKGGKPQNPKTINNRLACMAALFNWAIRNDYYTAQNPFKGLVIRSVKNTSSKYASFTTEELDILFHTPIYMGCIGDKWAQRLAEGKEIIEDSLYWVPLIALYTGMRLNEICQLHISDLKQEGGIWFFDINDDSHDKALKTSSSRRKVPLHQVLIKKELPAYKEKLEKQEEERLFPDLSFNKDGRYGFLFSKRFARLLKALRIKRAGLCFHSFRHNFIGDLRNTGVDRAIIMALVGHSTTNDIHSGYGNGYTLEILQENINKLAYPAIED